MNKKPNKPDTEGQISYQELKEDPEVVELTKKLVSIDSSDPGAYEAQIERYVYSWITQRIGKLTKKLPVNVNVDEIEPLKDRRCFKASIPGTSDKAALVLLCHLDTVMLGEGWDLDTPALGAILKDGRIYGRGACDMKGGMACAMLAFSDALDEIARRNQAPHRSIALICTCDEEDFMRGSEAAIAAGWLTGDQWVLDTEPSDGYIRMAHKGRTWFELTFQGQTAHASTPWRGADAIAACAEAISFIRDRTARLPQDSELGKTTVTFGQIKGGYRPYVVPDSCTVWIDMRLVPPTTPNDAKKIVDEAIAHAETAVDKTHGSYKITGNRPAISSHIDSPLLSAVRRSTKHICRDEANLKTFTGYSDSAVVAGTCHNPNCASYGPGSLEIAHKPNEYVPVEDLWRVRAVFSDLLKNAMWKSLER